MVSLDKLTMMAVSTSKDVRISDITTLFTIINTALLVFFAVAIGTILVLTIKFLLKKTKQQNNSNGK